MARKLSEIEQLRRRVKQLEAAIEWVPTLQPRRVLGGCELVIAQCEWEKLKQAAKREI